MARKFSPKFKAAALRLLDRGVFTREAQATLKKRYGAHVGEGTLRKWRAERDAAQAAALARRADEDDAPDPSSERDTAEPAEPEPPGEDSADPITDMAAHIKTQIAHAMRGAKQASADGNHTAAQRYSKQVAELTNLLARVEHQNKADTDVVSISRADFDAADRQALEILEALRLDAERTGGLTCSHCGRELRIALAKGEK